MTRLILVDNTVLSNFALVKRADLVLRLWATAAGTTSSVLAEYRAGAASGVLSPQAWAQLPVLTLTAEETEFASSLPPRLGAGERTCLSVAVHRRGILATDDLDARRMADEYGVSTTGSVGILALCVRRGHLTHEQANALLAAMIAAGYRSPIESLDALLD